MRRPWRLLPFRTAGAAWNMAVDEAVFRAYAEGWAPPTLRFYAWEPAAVSGGRFQDLAVEVNLAYCQTYGYDVVPRPTGGRAVLHEGDLTYAVVAGARDGIPDGVLPAYRHLSNGLLNGLARLGIPAEMQESVHKSNQPGGPACFASPSWYELTVAGRKVAGSAQRREPGGILQHGSLLLDFVPAKLAAILRSPLPASVYAEQLGRSAAGLNEFRPSLTRLELIEALIAGFAEALEIEPVPGDLTPAEETLAGELARDFRRRMEDILAAGEKGDGRP